MTDIVQMYREAEEANERYREALAVAQRDLEQVHASGSSPGNLALIDNALWRVRAARRGAPVRPQEGANE